MKNETMTIHEALAELKMLDSRISNKVYNATFAVANKSSNQKIAGKSINAFIGKATSDYQSIIDLMNRRKAIRNALSQSNAVTKITIGNKEYTVAEAIEMKKTGMNNARDLLNTMTEQMNSANRTIKNENERLQEKADQYVIGLVGSKDKLNSNEATTIRQAYVDANSYDLVALNNMQEIMQNLADEIAIFDAQVDAKISISNALTTITFEY